MIEIVLLYFLSRNIGALAIKKGLPALKWKLTMIGTWIIFELTGLFFAVAFFGTGNLVGLMAIAIASAFGGYLLIRYVLENKPDNTNIDDTNNIGRN